MVAHARGATARPLTALALALLLAASILGSSPTAAQSGKAKHGGDAPVASELIVHSAEFNGTLQEGSSNGAVASIENSGAPTASPFLVRFDVDGVPLGDAQMPAGFVGYGSPNAPHRWAAAAGARGPPVGGAPRHA